MEISQYNNIITIYNNKNTILKGLNDKLSEDSITQLLFSDNNTLTENSIIKYMLNVKTFDYPNEIEDKTIYYDSGFNKISNMTQISPIYNNNIIDYDISYYASQNVTKYLFLLDTLSEIYRNLINNYSNKTEPVNEFYINMRYVNNNNYWKVKEEGYNIIKMIVIKEIKVESFVINTNNENIKNIFEEFKPDILRHLNYLSNTDIIKGSLEYLENIQYFYKFCKIKLEYLIIYALKLNGLQINNKYLNENILSIYINFDEHIISTTELDDINSPYNKEILSTNSKLTKINTENKKNYETIAKNKNIIKTEARKESNVKYISAVTTIIFVIMVILFIIILSLNIHTGFKRLLILIISSFCIIFAIILYKVININNKEFFTIVDLSVTPVSPPIIESFISSSGILDTLQIASDGTNEDLAINLEIITQFTNETLNYIDELNGLYLETQDKLKIYQDILTDANVAQINYLNAKTAVEEAQAQTGANNRIVDAQSELDIQNSQYLTDMAKFEADKLAEQAAIDGIIADKNLLDIDTMTTNIMTQQLEIMNDILKINDENAKSQAINYITTTTNALVGVLNESIIYYTKLNAEAASTLEITLLEKIRLEKRLNDLTTQSNKNIDEVTKRHNILATEKALAINSLNVAKNNLLTELATTQDEKARATRDYLLKQAHYEELENIINNKLEDNRILTLNLEDTKTIANNIDIAGIINDVDIKILYNITNNVSKINYNIISPSLKTELKNYKEYNNTLSRLKNRSDVDINISKLTNKLEKIKIELLLNILIIISVCIFLYYFVYKSLNMFLLILILVIIAIAYYQLQYHSFVRTKNKNYYWIQPTQIKNLI